MIRLFIGSLFLAFTVAAGLGHVIASFLHDALACLGN